MKKINYLATTALAAGGLLLLGVGAARAQDVTSPTGAAPADIDLIAAFYVPDGANTSPDIGGGFSYEVDLGTLASLGSGASFSLGGDLANIYGSGWASASRPDALDWTVFGTNSTTGEFWTIDTGSGITEKLATSGSVTDATGLMDIAYDDLGGTPYISSGDSHAGELSNSSDQQDFANEFAPDWSYGSSWNSGTPLVNADNSAAIGFFDVVPGAGNHLSAEAGTFSLASSGNLTYTAAVPEPSTWASIIVGAVGLLAFRRRRVA